MDGLEGVIDAPEVDSPELDLDSPERESSSELSTESTDTDGPSSTDQVEAKDDPYSTRFGREYRQYLNSLKTTDPNSAKFVKQARDDYGRAFALKQLDPRGIDGIRENYATLQAIGGAEGLTGLQERIAGVEAVDQLIASGDPKAFDELGPDFAEGLAKLAPAYLDRISQSHPEAYKAAIMPHVVNSIVQSDFLKQFNDLVDILNIREQDDPRFDQQTKARLTHDRIGKMGKSLDAIAENASTARPSQGQADPLDTRAADLDKREQDSHWKTNIQSQTDPHANAKFEELFKSTNQRLKLDAGAKSDLRGAWIGATTKAMNADAAYVRQIKLFRSQKNPDPATVTNFVKNAINKHAETTLKSLVEARYGSFLRAKPKTATPTGRPGVKTGPVGPNIEVRSVKPPASEINHIKSHPLEMAQGIYTLYNGKKIQVVKPRA